jgi:outer membrane protein OmpA-like peptidoglycan-associated protein
MPRVAWLSTAVSLLWTSACASRPPAASIPDAPSPLPTLDAAVGVGARGVPEAARHLKLARDELERAAYLRRHGERAWAASYVRQSHADARLALALTLVENRRRAAEQARNRASYRSAPLAAVALTPDVATEPAGGALVSYEARGLVLRLPENLLFVPEKAEVSSAGRARLLELGGVLAERDATRPIFVDAYLDATASDQAAQALSALRAEAVRAVLLEAGLPAACVLAIGRGNAEPLRSNGSAAGRAENRRVEIVIGHASSAL